MEIGAGIIGGTAILAGTATVWKLIFPNKKYLPKDTFEEYKEGQGKEFSMLKGMVETGFKSVNDQLAILRKEIRNSK